MVEKRFRTKQQTIEQFPPMQEVVGEGDKAKTFMVSRSPEGRILFSINAEYYKPSVVKRGTPKRA